MKVADLSADLEQQFVNLIAEQSAPRAIEAVVALPLRFKALLGNQKKRSLSGIKIVLFDIYGTLFSSAAGDISTTDTAPDRPDRADRAAVYFKEAVLQRHLAGYGKTPYPEVRVEEIWEAYPERPPEMSGAEFALRYELAHNPVTPMPGALECIRQLRRGGYELGLVSNAQFYTPLLFKAFFGAGPEELGFNPLFIAYSYVQGYAKPAPELFQPVLQGLTKKGYRVDECLYVGNDMLNDVFGAKNVGMKAALFAGDRQSLRLRENNPLCGELLPDLVLTSLADLPGCLSDQV